MQCETACKDASGNKVPAPAKLSRDPGLWMRYSPPSGTEGHSDLAWTLAWPLVPLWRILHSLSHIPMLKDLVIIRNSFSYFEFDLTNPALAVMRSDFTGRGNYSFENLLAHKADPAPCRLPGQATCLHFPMPAQPFGSGKVKKHQPASDGIDVTAVRTDDYVEHQQSHPYLGALLAVSITDTYIGPHRSASERVSVFPPFLACLRLSLRKEDRGLLVQINGTLMPEAAGQVQLMGGQESGVSLLQMVLCTL
eukprot:gene9523-248_t